MIEPNKLVSVYSFCNTQFDIYHSGATTVTKDVLGSSSGYFTIEPGKYRVTFKTVYHSSSFWVPISVTYVTKSGEQRTVNNTANGTGNDFLETVTHEIDFSNIGNYHNQPFTIWVYLGSYGEGGTIIFEAID